MPKKFSPTQPKMTVVIVDCDGNVTSELCLARSAQLTFQRFVSDCVGRHSYIREISLYDLLIVYIKPTNNFTNGKT